MGNLFWMLPSILFRIKNSFSLPTACLLIIFLLLLYFFGDRFFFCLSNLSFYSVCLIYFGHLFIVFNFSDLCPIQVRFLNTSLFLSFDPSRVENLPSSLACGFISYWIPRKSFRLLSLRPWIFFNQIGLLSLNNRFLVCLNIFVSGVGLFLVWNPIVISFIFLILGKPIFMIFIGLIRSRRSSGFVENSITGIKVSEVVLIRNRL